MSSNKRAVVVGAGPVGLTAACLLVRQGIPVTVLEAGSDLSTESRASTFHPPTLDMLDDLGATLVLQPDANSQLWAAPSATSPWQPDEWTESVLGMLRADLPNLTYNATSMMTGSFFPATALAGL